VGRTGAKIQEKQDQVPIPQFRDRYCTESFPGISGTPNQPKNSSKLKEQSRNVYENKGSRWRTCERSGNVHENKGLILLPPECS
jgi:hypothetical protein